MLRCLLNYRELTVFERDVLIGRQRVVADRNPRGVRQLFPQHRLNRRVRGGVQSRGGLRPGGLLR